jgi:hypothetical protein
MRIFNKNNLTRPSFIVDDQSLPVAVTLLRKLDDVDFGTFESQLDPIAAGIDEYADPSTLLEECMKFMVLKKIAGDEDATTLSPTDVIDAVWHQLLLNPRLYRNINEALGGEMIDHDPEGGRDVPAHNERVTRTIEMYKTVFITPAASVASSMWKAPEAVELPIADYDINDICIRVRDWNHRETAFHCKKTMSVWKLLSLLAKERGAHMKGLKLVFRSVCLPCEQLIGDIVENNDVIKLRKYRDYRYDD